MYFLMARQGVLSPMELGVMGDVTHTSTHVHTRTLRGKSCGSEELRPDQTLCDTVHSVSAVSRVCAAADSVLFCAQNTSAP